MRWLSYAAVILAAQAANAVEPLTLSRALTEAARHNPSLRAAQAQVQAAGGRSLQSRLWPNPELELSVEEVPMNRSGLSRSQNMIGLAQTVPFPGKKALDGRIGRQELNAAEAEYYVRERELTREVSAAFYRALAAEKKLGVSRDLLALSASSLHAVAKRVEAGAAGAQENLRAEIETERAGLDVITADRELAEAQKTLATLLGRPAQQLEPLQGDLTLALPATVGSEHPRLRAARASQQRAELEYRRARLEPLPDVTLSVAVGRDTAADESLVAFRVSLPLPMFDRAQGRRREARALAEAARFDATATELRLTQESDVARTRLKAASDQVTAYQTLILPKAEEALRLVRGAFEAGKIGLLDLVDTQRTLAEVRLAYWGKLLELNLAQTDLEASAGASSAKE